MSPELDALDRALERAGEDAMLRRYTGTGSNRAFFDVPVRCLPVDFERAKALVNGLAQTESVVIVSPSGIVEGQWPATVDPPKGDVRVPLKDDKIIIQQRPRNINAAHPRYVGGELVRLTLVVEGRL